MRSQIFANIGGRKQEEGGRKDPNPNIGQFCQYWPILYWPILAATFWVVKQDFGQIWEVVVWRKFGNYWANIGGLGESLDS